MSYIDLAETITQIYKENIVNIPKNKTDPEDIVLRKDNEYLYEILNHTDKSYIFIFQKAVQFININVCIVNEIITKTNIKFYTVTDKRTEIHHISPNIKIENYDIIDKTDDYEVYMFGIFLFSLFKKKNEENVYQVDNCFYCGNIDNIIENFIKKANETKIINGITVEL